MSYIRQEEFGGIAPKIDSRKLATKYAQVAENCLFERSNLRPMRAGQSIGVTLGVGVERVFPYQGGWLQYTDKVSIAETPIANDTYERLFITSPITYPRVKSGAGTWRLGVPRPDALTVVGPALPPDEEIVEQLLETEDVYYVATLVDGFGAEGPPSLPSNVVTRIRNEPIEVTLPAAITGNYNLSGAVWRIYRSNSGTSDTQFQFVTDRAFGGAPTFTDTVLNDELQEVLPSRTWTGPPDDDTGTWPDGALQGMCLGPSGIMAGYAAKTVYFSEPYLPHAWPTEYAITIRDEIKAIVWISSGLLVVTSGQPVIISGTYPASMSVFIPERGWACTDGNSLADMSGWAIYNSTQGLVAVNGQQFMLLTEEFVHNNYWEAIVPKQNLLAGNSEGRYVMFWKRNGGLEKGSIIFDPQGGANALTTSTEWSDVAYSNPEDGILYTRDGSDELSKFDWGPNLTATWRSKTYIMPTVVNFAYLEIIANEYPVNVKIEAGNNSWKQGTGMTEILNASITERITALPHGFEYDHYEFEVSDDREIVMIGLYEDLTEVG